MYFTFEGPSLGTTAMGCEFEHSPFGSEWVKCTASSSLMMYAIHRNDNEESILEKRQMNVLHGLCGER